MSDLLNELVFIFQRFTWTSALDLVLVTLVVFGILLLLRDTQAIVLLRGVLLVIVLLSLVTSLVNLPAFSWLIQTMVPTLVIAIPVIFAPEIRRGLERLGRWRDPDHIHAEAHFIYRKVTADHSSVSSLPARAYPPANMER